MGVERKKLVLIECECGRKFSAPTAQEDQQWVYVSFMWRQFCPNCGRRVMGVFPVVSSE